MKPGGWTTGGPTQQFSLPEQGEVWGKSSIPLRGTSGRTRHTKIQTPPDMDTDRCPECLRAALSHDIILRDDDIP